MVSGWRFTLGMFGQTLFWNIILYRSYVNIDAKGGDYKWIKKRKKPASVVAVIAKNA